MPSAQFTQASLTVCFVLDVLVVPHLKSRIYSGANRSKHSIDQTHRFYKMQSNGRAGILLFEDCKQPFEVLYCLQMKKEKGGRSYVFCKDAEFFGGKPPAEQP
jgi:hypothetical protein